MSSLTIEEKKAKPNLGELAELARYEMVQPFQQWVAKKRHETEVRVYRRRERLRAISREYRNQPKASTGEK